MKKSELKNIIKECVKEVIFEEGVLSGIITEVAKGLQAPKLVQETAKTREARSHNSGPNREGTRPAPSGDGRGPLSGVDPNDSGVDLNNIPGMSSWASLAKGAR
jgi:hypothetical protein